MTLPAGQISLGEVNVELGLASTTLISLNQASVRTLAGVPSGQIAMSNLQGKANASNFFGTVYDTSDPFSTDSATYGVAYSGSTMFTVGVQKLLTAGTTTLLICSYTSTGTLNWKKYISSTNIDPSVERLGPSCVCDSAGNLYVVYVTAGGQNRTMKLNSSGVIQWQKRISGLSGSFNTPFILAVDSSDGLYIAGQYNTSKRGLIKFDTSGSSVWAYELSASGQGTINNDTKMALTTGGGYVYVFSNGGVPGGGAGHVLFRISTAGSLNATVSMSGAYAYGASVSASSQLVIGARTGGSFNVGLIAQFDPTALTSGPTWQKGLAATTFVNAVATDSSDNVYVACTNETTTRRFTFAKYNSSGTLQLQRRWTESTDARNAYAYTIAMASSGKVAVNGLNSNNVLHGGITVIFNTIVPTDGTATGTYSNNGVSYVYDASTMTTTSPSFSYTSQTGTATSFSTDFIAASETIADATNLTSTVTII
jgi:hypothetical protein